MKSTYYAYSDRALAHKCYILDNGKDITKHINGTIVAFGLTLSEIPLEYKKYSEDEASYFFGVWSNGGWKNY